MNDVVSCVIPEGRTTNEVVDNTNASNRPKVNDDLMQKVAKIYSTHIRSPVFNLW